MPEVDGGGWRGVLLALSNGSGEAETVPGPRCSQALCFCSICGKVNMKEVIIVLRLDP